jgi:hypothetical protein
MCIVTSEPGDLRTTIIHLLTSPESCESLQAGISILRSAEEYCTPCLCISINTSTLAVMVVSISAFGNRLATFNSLTRISMREFVFDP